MSKNKSIELTNEQGETVLTTAEYLSEWESLGFFIKVDEVEAPKLNTRKGK